MRQALRSLQKSFRPPVRHFAISVPRRAKAQPSLDEAAPVTVPATFAKVRLREYQEECIQSVLSYLDKGHKRLGVSLATGSGKTVIFTQLIDRIRPRSDHADQTLILVHRRELVEQAARHCTNAYPTKRIEIEMGNLHASGTADITVASVQSIRSGDRMSKFDPERFKLVLVDEAHHIVAPGYMETLDHFGLLGFTESSPALVGVSATFSRFDGLKLGAAIDHIVYHKDYVDMIGDNWLSKVIFTTVQSKADLSKVKSASSGDFRQVELSNAINTDKTNDITVRAWLARAKDRKSTLVFCVDLAHVAGLTHAFRKHGIDAHFITGETAKMTRSETLEAFKKGEFPVLLNCGVFTEGTDIPNIDCVLLARPTKSRNLLVQMIGRGMRLHPGKENCHIIDMVASLETGIVTTPTLFGLDPSELVENSEAADLRDLKDRKEEEKRREERVMQDESLIQKGSNSNSAIRSPSSITFTDYDSVFDLIEDTSGERRIRAISPLAWVEVDDSKHILTTKGQGFITIQKDSETLFKVWETSPLYRATSSTANTGGRISKSPFMRPRTIASAESLPAAVHAADTYASEKFPWIIISKEQPWRKGPASEGQLNLLNKFRSTDDQLTPERVTKGKAGDMISKIKHGARRRFGKIEVGQRRKARERTKIERVEEMKKNEEVKVGPLKG
ncbi:MAG: hypothetical protein M4579_001694 [Chaenotheca gracillima]|nr:MAG: hypothetical protein M4579_001694 [Chaenotheca gracillima]